MNSVTAIEKFSKLDLNKARFAVAAMFFINGAAVATWISRIPAVQQSLHLNTGMLGIALLSMAVGAVFSMPLSGVLVTRYGSRPVTSWSMILSCAVLPFPAMCSTLPTLCLTIAILGVCLSCMDVAMNAHAVCVERLFGRPIMSSFHALFSIAGIAGAILGSITEWLKLSTLTHFSTAAVVLVLAGLAIKGLLLPASEDSRGEQKGSRSTVTIYNNKYLAILSLITFACFLNEGAMGDWTGVYLKDVLHTPSSFWPLGYAAFATAMSLGRLSGDRLNEQFGAASLVRTGAVIASGGLIIALTMPSPVVALLGFAAVGAGLSNIVPIMFTAAGNAPDVEAGKGIATVSVIGYLGLLAGPPIIGFAAEYIQLPMAMGFILLMCVVIFTFAGTVRNQRQPLKP